MANTNTRRSLTRASKSLKETYSHVRISGNDASQPRLDRAATRSEHAVQRPNKPKLLQHVRTPMDTDRQHTYSDIPGAEATTSREVRLAALDARRNSVEGSES